MNAINRLKNDNIQWINSVFTDIRGLIQDVVIPAENFSESNAFKSGIGFDGSSIRGYKKIHESDMIFRPDLETLHVIPWNDSQYQKSAIVLGDIYEAFGSSTPSDVDPRGYVARRAVKAAEVMGYKSYFGSELEFFVFESIDPTNLHWDPWVSPSGGSGDSWGAPRVIPISPETKPGNTVIRPKEAYFRAPPDDTTYEYRNEVASILKEYFGFEIEMHHHEVATNGQVEIDFKYGDIIETADRTLLYKFVAKNVAKRHGLIATFMPKPVYLDNASGMHVHTSLWENRAGVEINVMYDESDEYAELSQIGRYCIGGLLEHARALTAVCCPIVNSYKRLVPGFEAPINIMWSRRNRSALVRVPVYFKGKEFASQKRLEYRAVDPSCNPYLAYSCIQNAMLDGIKKNIDPGDPVDKDVYEFSAAEKTSHRIKELPTTLKEALEEMTTDDVIKDTLDSHIFDAFIELKTNDWNQYCLYVTPWEIMKYLDY